MELKYATELKVGNLVVIDNVPCVVKSVDISKTGKHGASKVRIEALGILDAKKRIVVMPGSERLAVPIIEKRKAQLLSLNKQQRQATVMDLESFETFDVLVDPEIVEKVQEGAQVEYWKIEGQRIVKRLA